MSRVVHTGQGPVTLPDKDPDDRAWYGVVWDEELSDGITITSSEWVVSGLNVEAELESESMTLDGLTYAHVNKVLLSGGTAGQSYLVTNRIETSDSQQLDKSFYVPVSEQ